MAGIYIHIPFCVSRCGYCDFYKTTNFEQKESFVSLLLREIELRKNYLEGSLINTIYFGGGTPSVLSLPQFENIFKLLKSCFLIDANAEITVECNPDDISLTLLKGLKQLGVNRLSLGIQSFDDSVLRFMERRHNSQQAMDAITLARNVGFTNISIDLIYGLPNLTIDDWKRNLDKALLLNVEHISAYHLTYEKDTKFDKLLKRGLIKEVDEDSSVAQFDLLLNSLQNAQFEQYEVSNFCRDQKYSKHNTNYWRGINYLGLGPSAHSFNGETRSWNVGNLSNYIISLEKDILPLEIEYLSQIDKYNELIMVGLRTKWGVDLKAIEYLCSPTLLNHFNSVLKKNIHLKNVTLSEGKILLPPQLRMISDSIICDFFFTESK